MSTPDTWSAPKYDKKGSVHTTGNCRSFGCVCNLAPPHPSPDSPADPLVVRPMSDNIGYLDRLCEVMHDDNEAAIDAAADLLDAIDALHQPSYAAFPDGTKFYCTCGKYDCRTARLLHPEEQT
jgi:hypothetical protein